MCGSEPDAFTGPLLVVMRMYQRRTKMAVNIHPVNLPTASEFIEFARKSNAINLDITAATLLESADGILRQRPGYVLFNIRCGMLIVERPEIEVVIRNVTREG